MACTEAEVLHNTRILSGRAHSIIYILHPRSLSLSVIHTHTLTHSLCVLHTHTTLCRWWEEHRGAVDGLHRSGSLTQDMQIIRQGSFYNIYFTPTLTLSVIHTHTFSLWHPPPHTHTHSLSVTHTHTLSHTHLHTLSLSHPPTHSLCVIHTHTYTHTLSVTHTHYKYMHYRWWVGTMRIEENYLSLSSNRSFYKLYQKRIGNGNPAGRHYKDCNCQFLEANLAAESLFLFFQVLLKLRLCAPDIWHRVVVVIIHTCQQQIRVCLGFLPN